MSDIVTFSADVTEIGLQYVKKVSVIQMMAISWSRSTANRALLFLLTSAQLFPVL